MRAVGQSYRITGSNIDNDFRSFVRVHLSPVCLFQHRLRMDRIEKVIYVDTLQSQSAVQNIFAPYGEISSTDSVRLLARLGIRSLMQNGPGLLHPVDPVQVERDGQVHRGLGILLHIHLLLFVLLSVILVSLYGLLVLA
ncbi:hypothetical protein BDM02DRAFT_1345643 [Thelephora ganbajun]|uniref:Uncharacterized protein n=1 Tax=Thelephora ganbajun TaxID=370292 RepID=A0ACB6ZME6_THEGA|nr:hypothetical protein BDM02DRAFT_1345643 [Thelephora ganbajun]